MIVPAFTCWSVAASVVRAGLRLRLVDVDPSTLSPRETEIEGALRDDVLAVIAPHLLAPSVDSASLVSRTRLRKVGARLIEDAAQAWPRNSARAADGVVLSFGRGKPCPLGGGGALLVHEDVPCEAPASRGLGLASATSLLASVAMGRPSTYALPSALPWLKLGETVYDPDFDLDRSFRPWSARLGLEALDGLVDNAARRSAHARWIGAAVEGLPHWSFPASNECDGPLRFAALAPSRSVRDRVLDRLRQDGVCASGLYPGTLADIPAARPHITNPDESFPGARRLVDTLATLPCYPDLTGAQVQHVATSFARAACAVRAPGAESR